MRIGMCARCVTNQGSFASPPLRSQTSHAGPIVAPRARRESVAVEKCDDPELRYLRLEPEQTRSRLARGIWHRATRFYLGRGWPGTQNEGISPRLGNGGLVGTILTVVVACGLLFPECAAAQSKKEKAAQTAAQPISSKPKVPTGSDPGGVAVAIIGSGVNYTLPQIANRLARDGEGDIIGLDFIDRDNRPFDVAGPDATPDGIRPMGTTLASVLLGDAKIRLVPVRIGMGEPRQFGGAIAFVASTPARIAIVAHSSTNRADWETFEQTAKTVAANVLFIIPAGDVGQDLDKQPHYPASLQLQNAIVVTTAEAGGCPILTTLANYGDGTVDLAVRTVAMEGVGFNGMAVSVGGSAYAAALAARKAAELLGTNAGMTAVDLKAKIGTLTKPHLVPTPPRSMSSAPRTRFGVLEDPPGSTICAGEPHRF